MAQSQPIDKKQACTTISIHKSTKEKLDQIKAPGQNYNGIICQLIEVWLLAKDRNGFLSVINDTGSTNQAEIGTGEEIRQSS
jgi:hypothetical protein